MQNSIEKVIELSASVARVWRALTDHKEFGEWFRVDIEGPFAVGEVSRGLMTHPGCKNMRWEAKVVRMDAERLFSFEWCPFAHDPDGDYSNEPNTLVEFRLESTSDGTRLHLSESGFNDLPDIHRVDVLRSNTHGWNEQVKNIIAHVQS